jgi:hypothetical protein
MKENGYELDTRHLFSAAVRLPKLGKCADQVIRIAAAA